MADGTFDFGLLDDDVVIWHSYDGLDMTLDEERALVDSTRQTVADVRAVGTTIRRHARGALLDYRLRVEMRDGSVLDAPAFALVRMEDDRITRIEEYLEVDASDAASDEGRVTP
jgi:ketosteroid isomerase-like protein